jgi:hypothetical protein
LLCVAVTSVLWGCVGPIDYISTTAISARRAVAEAKAAGAKELAPYEYWSAVTYLHMSREKAAYADYQVSWEYGRKAKAMAKLARKLAAEKAEAGPTGAAEPDVETPPVVVEPRGKDQPAVVVEPDAEEQPEPAEDEEVER